MLTDYLSSTPSWAYLAQLRRRGQKPDELLILTDHEGQRRNLVESGAFALSMPTEEEDYLVAGLDLALLANYSKPFLLEISRVARANPRWFRIYFRGPRQFLWDVTGWGNTYPRFPVT